MTLKGQNWPDEKVMKSFPLVLFSWCLAVVGWCPKGKVSQCLF